MTTSKWCLDNDDGCQSKATYSPTWTRSPAPRVPGRAIAELQSARHRDNFFLAVKTLWSLEQRDKRPRRCGIC